VLQIVTLQKSIESNPIIQYNQKNHSHMARIKLSLPERQIAQCTIPVRISDINYGNHVGNDSFVSIIHESRVQWLKQHGFTELDIDGTGLIMADLAMEFKRESFYGDQVTVTIFAGEISRIGFELYYQISVERDAIPIVLVIAKTGMVCYDYVQKKTASIPKALSKILVADTGEV